MKRSTVVIAAVLTGILAAGSVAGQEIPGVQLPAMDLKPPDFTLRVPVEVESLVAGVSSIRVWCALTRIPVGELDPAERPDDADIAGYDLTTAEVDPETGSFSGEVVVELDVPSPESVRAYWCSLQVASSPLWQSAGVTPATTPAEGTPFVPVVAGAIR
jgi:hypothetical protein